MIKYDKFWLIPLILIGFMVSCRPTTITAPTPESTHTLPPSASFPIIDGTISDMEWSKAKMYTLQDGSDLYLFQDNGILYLAVIGSRPGTLGANIFLHQNNQVRVMHISAALGTAEYNWDGEKWSLIRNFDWQHRTLGNGDLALAEREAYYKEEGWSAPNARTGTANNLEMQLKLASGKQRLAVSLIRSSSNIRTVWPADLGDDTETPFSDGLPINLSVEPDKWYLIP